MDQLVTKTRIKMSFTNHVQHTVEWITLNIATAVTTFYAFSGTKLFIEIIGGLSLIVLMIFNFVRAMNEYQDYIIKKRIENIRRIKELEKSIKQDETPPEID